MIKRESFDYTIWHREYFGDMGLDEIKKEAVSFAEEHPHKGEGTRVWKISKPRALFWKKPGR